MERSETLGAAAHPRRGARRLEAMICPWRYPPFAHNVEFAEYVLSREFNSGETQEGDYFPKAIFHGRDESRTRKVNTTGQATIVANQGQVSQEIF